MEAQLCTKMVMEPTLEVACEVEVLQASPSSCTTACCASAAATAAMLDYSLG
ncbi:hypothetical protein HaLaN_18318, partial [Haematococcus lacustris]